MKTTVILPILAIVLAMASCSAAGDYTGTERGLNWDVETTLGANIRGRSTTYKHKEEKPLGTLTLSPDGAMDMTGPAVEKWAEMMFCDAAPNAAECNGF